MTHRHSRAGDTRARSNGRLGRMGAWRAAPVRTYECEQYERCVRWSSRSSCVTSGRSPRGILTGP
eukprot:5054517-Prymnesium_polylepis.1